MKTTHTCIRPKLGSVIEIGVRQGRITFTVGHCRGLVLSEGLIRFVGGFRRCTDPAMSVTWAEASDWRFLAKRQFSIACVPEQEWMTPLIPHAAASQPEEAA